MKFSRVSLITASLLTCFIIGIWVVSVTFMVDQDKTVSSYTSDSKVYAAEVNLDGQVIPIFGAASCQNNPDGYVYFQSDMELFHYHENSSIKLALQDFSANNHGIGADGCKQTPYWRNTKLFLAIDSMQMQKLRDESAIPRFETIYLEKVPASSKDLVSPEQYLLESKFEKCKQFRFPITTLKNHIEQCTIDYFKADDSFNKNPFFLKVEQTFYRSIHNRPFFMACENYVGQLICEVHYRLYKSVDLHYSFYKSSFDVQHILELDDYLKTTISEMHVTR